MSVILERPAKKVETTPFSGEQRLVLYGIDWQTYGKLLDAFGERPLHLTYDCGKLEIMTLSPRHERLKKWLARLIEAMCLELSIAIACFGSTTYRREDLQRGLEPDDCYYIRNEALVRDKDKLDLAHDPPPDLAVEIEVTESVAGRMDVYAALRVPELWRYDGETLRVYLLSQAGIHELSQNSLNFPFLPLAEFAQFLRRPQGVDETSQLQAFLAWIRTRVVPTLKNSNQGDGPLP